MPPKSHGPEESAQAPELIKKTEDDAEVLRVIPGAVQIAQEHVRRLLVDFRMGANDADNPLEGKITLKINGYEAVERQLQDASIYLVDDEPLMLRILGNILMINQFQNVKKFANGAEALESMYRNGELVEVPHLIITDTNMPGMGGQELARKLQKIDPLLRPRLIATTGLMHDKNISTYVHLGHPVLDKPFTAEDLLALIPQELRRHPGFRTENK